MKYTCDTCGEVFEGNEKGPYIGAITIVTNGDWYHLSCANKVSDKNVIGFKIDLPSPGKLIVEVNAK